MGLFRRKKIDEDLFEEDTLVSPEDDEYDPDFCFEDEGPGVIASLFISILTILGVTAGCVAAAYFLSGINITIRGGDVVEVPVFSEYHDQGATAEFDMLKDVTWSVVSHDNVNTDVVGEYQVVYEAEYHYWKATKTRTVKVIDNRCPVIKLKGGRKVTWSEMGHKEPGYKATDNYDGDMTDQVQVETVVAEDGNTATMTYTVTDSSGNVGMSVRHIFLKDVIAPTLELEGALRIEIAWGGTFNEPGYKAYDDLDGDLTSKVSVSSVNNTKSGEQLVTYQVMDEAGNTATKTRTVVVGQKPVTKKDTKKDDKKDSDKKKDSKKNEMTPSND